jgi:hypothetical protein
LALIRQCGDEHAAEIEKLIADPRTAPGRGAEPLQRYLRFMLWVKDRTGGGDYRERARKDPKLVTEHERTFRKG